MAILLDAYAARSCAVKTHNIFDASLDKTTWQPDEALQDLFDGGEQFEIEVLEELASRFTGTLVDLRPLALESWAAQTDACLDAMESGVEVILGAALPPDVAGHRAGRVDLLVRGADGEDGAPGYHPVEVKFHLIHERKAATKTPRPNSSITYTTFDAPSPKQAGEQPGLAFRINTREADLVQVAHYYRMLEAVGHAPGGPRLAGVIGTDTSLHQRMITWIDLDEPLVRTFSRSAAAGWTTRSILQRYDHEHVFRVKVAQVAAKTTGGPDDPEPLVHPIRTKECERCPWWEHCLPKLDPADVSLNINKSALDVREISALRRHGITTLTDLVDADLPDLLKSYLPEVTHRSGAEKRLQLALRRARLLTAGTDLVRETTDPIPLPDVDLEIDFDIETSSDSRVYLWGFWVNDVRTAASPRYVHFARFDDLSEATEHDLAVRAMSWLRDLADGPDRIAVFHYSRFEVAKIIELAEARPDPVLDWARSYAEESFVDLYELVRNNFFGVGGLGLKVVATKGAGFSWRDDDPGGLNSQRWFLEAVHGENAEVRHLAQQRVLEYNEDDVRATAAVRTWLRTPDAP